jgi:hypothetical protein
MRSNIALVLCMGAVIVEALVAWHTHEITHSGVNLVACVWLASGLWLGGRLGAILHRSPKGIYQEFRNKEPRPGLSKLIFNGGLLLELASLALLFR